jgi:hypothetical protein
MKKIEDAAEESFVRPMLNSHAQPSPLAEEFLKSTLARLEASHKVRAVLRNWIKGGNAKARGAAAGKD